MLRREIGVALYRVMNESSFDASAVTVTHVFVGSDLRNATVLVSIRGGSKQQKTMLGLLARHRGDIQSHIGRTVILKYTPRLTFRLDTSLAEGDRVLDILRTIDNEEEHACPNE